VVRVMVMVRVSIRVYVMILFCRSIALFSVFTHSTSIFRIPQFRIIHIPADYDCDHNCLSLWCHIHNVI